MRAPHGSDMPPVPPSACSRCNHQFPDLAEVRPDIAEYIAQLHLLTCPRSSNEERFEAAQCLAASGTSGTNVPLIADPVQPSQNIVVAKSSAPRKRKKYKTDMAERKAALEADEWATDVTKTSIFCKGCEKRIKLDKRNLYYPGLWTKHRDKCKGIKKFPGKLAINKKSRKKSAIGSADQAMGMGNVTPTRSEEFDGTASPREGVTRSMSHECGFSPYPQTSTRSRSSGGASSVAGPSTHRDRDEVVYSLPEEYVVPPPEQRESNYGIWSTTRPPPVVAPVGEIPFVSCTHDEPSTLRKDYTRPSFLTQKGREEARVGSDEYWSGAPFAKGSGYSMAGSNRYRYSTRWELTHEFPSSRKRGYKSSESGSGSHSDSESGEEMSSASP
ncbi:hypothetical protein BDZ94DRAFT_1272401 [Collybia nuda]|uniref:Uncharacterized protein n=1 Tax=Collybia nuda TaxID=64659 RepID=A0A9P5XW49_9AGAR|nr:hypothetical protein BDZ94DRAFT_1272401 [Collybia nuda]